MNEEALAGPSGQGSRTDGTNRDRRRKLRAPASIARAIPGALAGPPASRVIPGIASGRSPTGTSLTAAGTRNLQGAFWIQRRTRAPRESCETAGVSRPRNHTRAAASLRQTPVACAMSLRHSGDGSPGTCCAATARGSSVADVDCDAVPRFPAVIASCAPSLRAVRSAIPARPLASSLLLARSASNFLSLRSQAAWIALSRFAASLSNCCSRFAASLSNRSSRFVASSLEPFLALRGLPRRSAAHASAAWVSNRSSRFADSAFEALHQGLGGLLPLRGFACRSAHATPGIPCRNAHTTPRPPCHSARAGVGSPAFARCAACTRSLPAAPRERSARWLRGSRTPPNRPCLLLYIGNESTQSLAARSSLSVASNACAPPQPVLARARHLGVRQDLPQDRIPWRPCRTALPAEPAPARSFHCPAHDSDRTTGLSFPELFVTPRLLFGIHLDVGRSALMAWC